MKSLPEGLIATTDTLPSDLDGLEGVEVGDIAQLWRGGLIVSVVSICLTEKCIIQTRMSITGSPDTGWRTSFGGFGGVRFF